MATFGEFFSRQKTVFRQQQEIKKLNAELQTLRAQNESMREGRLNKALAVISILPPD